MVFNSLRNQINFPRNILELIGRWSKYYMWSFTRKKNEKDMGNLYKVLCWNFWLAKNKIIFQNKEENNTKVVAKANGLLGINSRPKK